LFTVWVGEEEVQAEHLIDNQGERSLCVPQWD